MAEAIVEGRNEPYEGNPLLDFKDINFLDKMSYKNPKKLKRFFKGRSSNVDEAINLGDVNRLNTEEDKIFFKYLTNKRQYGPKTCAETEEDFLKHEMKKRRICEDML